MTKKQNIFLASTSAHMMKHPETYRSESKPGKVSLRSNIILILYLYYILKDVGAIGMIEFITNYFESWDI